MPGGKIFISYRREDTSGHALALYDKLHDHFSYRVFKDISSIEAGLDWEQAIERALDSSDVCIVLIGKQWFTVKDKSGQRRLDNAKDTLRREIVTALKRKVRVIPTLVNGATMPTAEDLPAELQPLAGRQAHEIPDEYWDDGVKRLIETIERVLDISTKEQTPRGPKPQSPPPLPAQALPPTLPELLPGNWQIQFRQPLTGMIAQATLAISPQGMFRGQIATPLGIMTVVEGQWQILPGNQVVLQGREATPLLVVPYGFAAQFMQIGQNQLTGVTSAGEEMVWQRIG